MEIKDIFGEEALTYAQFSEKAGKSKFVDLSTGAYVSKEKYGAAVSERDALQEKLNTANEAAKKFEGVDLDELKQQLEDEKTGRAKDRRAYALKSALSGAGCKDLDYVLFKLGDKAEFDESDELKDKDGFIKQAVESCSVAFEKSKNPPPPVLGDPAQTYNLDTDNMEEYIKARKNV